MLLNAVDISKSFGKFRVLNNISLQLKGGEIMGVIGPNGAGKTTLINVLTGALSPDGGKIYFRGLDITKLKAYERFRIGIGRTFQNVRPFLSLTVKENIIIAAKHRGEKNPTVVDDIMRVLHIERFSDRVVSDCNLFVRKKVELAKAIVGKTFLVFLDEPFAGLTEPEVDEFIEIIRSLNKTGITFVIVEHVISALVRIASKIMVLHLGTKLAEGSPTEIVNNSDVIRIYLGERVESAGS